MCIRDRKNTNGNGPGPGPGPGPGYGPMPEIKTQFNGLEASTTAFHFGGTTSCGCSNDIANSLVSKTNGKWVAAAAPDWLVAPFLSFGSDPVPADDPNHPRIPDGAGSEFYSNCGAGVGGCGTCWSLTTTGETNIYADDPNQVPAGKTANVVIVDTCEDRNAYGNNTQWCIAAASVPEKGYRTDKQQDNPNYSRWKNLLKLGSFSLGEDAVHWMPDKDCIKDGKWNCTNLAGKPVHIDIALQSLDQPNYKMWTKNRWEADRNPIVKIKRVSCPPEVTDIVRNNCGGNVLGRNKCNYYCTDSKGEPLPKVPDWWSSCPSPKSNT